MNILMLTSVYSLPNDINKNATKIVNSFVDEWVKAGHNVIVIHNIHRYPSIIHKIPKSIKRKLAVKMGYDIPDMCDVQNSEQMLNGAKVYRIGILKLLPHKAPSENVIFKQVDKIENALKKENFTPDVITGHWASPQMEIISKLKGIYNCKTAVVLHGTGYVRDSSFNTQKYLAGIDNLGARSFSQARQIKEILNLEKEPFVCNSGVPDSYLESYELNLSKFDCIQKWKFVYVGRLVAYKNIDATICALAKITDHEWEFNILGDGAARTDLEKLCEELGCQDRVRFYGRVPRDEVMRVLSESHVFVMISINEIFGLVYLESMAASCITIASKNGGVDGIIVDGENGYLCEEGNSENLKEIIDKITSSTAENIKCLVKNGYETTLNLTDSKVAERYLNAITE